MPFMQWNITAPNQGSQVMRDHFGYLALIIGDIKWWQKQGLISSPKSQCGQGAFKDMMIELNQEAPKLLFVVFWKQPFCTGCLNQLSAAFPCYGKEGILLPKQVYHQRRSSLEYFLGIETSCTERVLRDQETTFGLSPKTCIEIQAGGEEGKGCFAEHRCIWASVFSLS